MQFLLKIIYLIATINIAFFAYGYSWHLLHWQPKPAMCMYTDTLEIVPCPPNYNPHTGKLE